MAPSSMIQSLIAHARRQIDQVERRLLKVAHDEKVFSIFEEHTRWVSKGKAGCAVELGVPVCVVEDQFQILHHKILWEGSDTDIAVSVINETQALHPDLRVCSFDRGFHSPGNRGQLDAMLDLNALRARVGFLWPSANASKRKHSPRQGASTRRSSRQSTTSSIAVSIGFAPTAPISLSILAANPPHRRLCDGACVKPNDVEDAALPERGHHLRISPPRPAHDHGHGLRCPRIGNVDRFDAERPSVMSMRPVPWLKPRRKCRGASQISCGSGGFLADTKYLSGNANHIGCLAWIRC